MYPYISDEKCKNCQEIITIKQRRDKDNQFCSRECYNQFRRRGAVKINLNAHCTCLRCEKSFIPTRNTLGMYCSYACSNGAKSVSYELVCQCCGTTFEINNIAEIKRGHYKYCSNECRKRKYKINESFFNEINETTSYWLGFIWATIRDTKSNKISLLSKKELLDRFNLSFDSNYPVKKSISNRYMVRITSTHLLNRLTDLGLKPNPYLEFPEISSQFHKDFIRGYFDSDCGYHYKDGGKDIVSLHGKSSKLMRSISDILKSNLVANKGEWVSVSFNFDVDGIPRLEDKWMKFNHNMDKKS